MPVARKAQKKLGLEEGVAWLRQRYGGRLVPPLEGLAYRFAVWLPVLSRGKAVVSGEQRLLLPFTTASAALRNRRLKAFHRGLGPGFRQEPASRSLTITSC